MNGGAMSRINALTGIRYFAAIFVAIHHFAPPSRINLGPSINRLIFAMGDGSVSVFFVLSGIVLVYSNVDPRGFLKKSNRQFYVARLARIYPVYLFGLILIAPFVIVDILTDHPGLIPSGGRIAAYGLTSVFLIQTWTPFALGWNGPGWSLSAEAFFYLLFPWLVASLNTGYRTRMLILAICVGLSALLSILTILYPSGLQTGLGDIDFNSLPLFRVPEFICGMILGYAVSNKGDHPLNGDSVKITAILSIFLLFVFSAFAPLFLYRALSLTTTILLLYSLSISRGGIGKVLGQGALVSLGAASYSLYIIHVPLFRYFSFAVLHGHRQVDTWPQLGLFLIILTIVSLFVHRWIEIPAATLVNRSFGGKGNASLEADQRTIEPAVNQAK